jgi:hypothetical protein
LAYGANDAVASIAAAIMAAEALSRSDLGHFTYQPLFFFADADEWNLSGSSRFVNDIAGRFSCKNYIKSTETKHGLPLCANPIYPSTLFQSISAESIAYIISIDQIGKTSQVDKSDISQLYLHGYSTNNCEDISIVNDALSASKNIPGIRLNVSKSTSTFLNSQEYSDCRKNLPLTPLTAFANDAAKNSQWNFQGLIMTGYDDHFLDPVYHTRLDISQYISRSDIFR